VYATALNSGVDGSLPLITPATVLQDEPTTFEFADGSYAPKNYEGDYRGSVTVRAALTHSLNVPAVSLAEMVGYNKVRNLALAAGFNPQLEPTPALALGAYVATPLEVAGAYTVFADHGEYVAPRCIVAVVDTGGRTVWENPVRSRPVLDLRVSYLMVSLLESVINNGTGAGVRSRGFTFPAAGKTGTSHDGWFAGFTSNLLGIVWVGYDDDRELKLSGAAAALPIWTEFMKRAVKAPGYQDPGPFSMPEGVISVPIETNSTTSEAKIVRNEVFIAGTEPQQAQPLKTVKGILGRLFHPLAEPNLPAVAVVPPATVELQPPPAAKTPEVPSTQSRRGVIKKFLSIFRSKHSNSGTPPEPESKSAPQE
jgi:penicillin-binding protein 1B